MKHFILNLLMVACTTCNAAQQIGTKTHIEAYIDETDWSQVDINIEETCEQNYERALGSYREAYYLLCLEKVARISENDLSEELSCKISTILIDISQKIVEKSGSLVDYIIIFDEIATKAKNIEIRLRAEYCLGYINYHAQLEPDFAAAMAFFKPLTEQSIDLYAKREACAGLAFIFADGEHGVEKNEIMAIYYAKLALQYFGEKAPQDIISLALELQEKPAPTRRASLDLSLKFIETRRASV